MAFKTIDELKAFFETGDKPKAAEFANLIDTLGKSWERFDDLAALQLAYPTGESNQVVLVGLASAAKTIYGWNGAAWAAIGGAGGGAVDSVNGNTGAVVLDADDISDTSTTKKFATAAELTKLAGIEDGATADQTGAEIKTAYEAEADTNAFTDALLSKLNGVEDSATADQTGAQIKVLYEAEADTNALTDDKLNEITANTAARYTAPDAKTASEFTTDKIVLKRQTRTVYGTIDTPVTDTAWGLSTTSGDLEHFGEATIFFNGGRPVMPSNFYLRGNDSFVADTDIRFDLQLTQESPQRVEYVISAVNTFGSTDLVDQMLDLGSWRAMFSAHTPTGNLENTSDVTASDGDNVKTWIDRSPNANSAVQTSASEQEEYEAATKSVDFDNVATAYGQYVTPSDILVPAGGGTIWIVHTSGNTGDDIPIAHKTSTNSVIVQNASIYLGLGGVNNRTIPITSGSVKNQKYVLCIEIEGTELRAYRNGSSIGTLTGNDLTGNNYTFNAIGAYQSGSNQKLDGPLHFIGFQAKINSDSGRASGFNYLETEFGI